MCIRDRDTVSGRQPHPVAHHQLFRGKRNPRTAPAHMHCGRNHGSEVIGNALCPEFLNKTENAADQQHSQNDGRCGDAAAEVGRQNHIRHEGENGQNEQDDGKGIDKRPSQPIEHRVRRPAGQTVGRCV